MKICSMELINYRNYQKFNGIFSSSLNIFVGPNAQGKTNLIEALYLIGATKSFRRLEQDHLIKLDCQSASVKAIVNKNDLEKEVQFKFIENKRKEILLNNKRVSKTSDYIGQINVTLFSPDDLMLIKGDASYRRRFIDTLLCQTDKIYLKDLIDYHRVLKHRNMILKDIKSNQRSLHDCVPWNEQLCRLSVKIIKKRSELCNHINNIAQKVHYVIKNDEKLSVHFQDSVWQGSQSYKDMDENIFYDKLKEVTSEEIARGTTLIGPHRDNLLIKINDLNSRTFGSQGQQRSAAISLRMAEVDYIYEQMNDYPILLLDDMFSELDDERKQFIFAYLDKQLQVFLTGTRQEDFKPLWQQARVYSINKGRATRIKE